MSQLPTTMLRDPNSKALNINDPIGLAQRKAQLSNNQLEDRIRRLESDIVELKTVLLKKLSRLESLTHPE